MRLAYVGNFTKPWCTENHVVLSLQRLGHDVVKLQENQVNWSVIPALVTRRRARLLLWTRTWHTEREPAIAALDALRATGVPSVSFHLDRWFGLDREYQIEEEPFFQTDLVVTAYGGQPERWADYGVNHRWLPPAVLADECSPVAPDPRRWPYDVVFVGSVPYGHAEWWPIRKRLLDAVERRFGRRFAIFPIMGRPLRGRSLTQLYSTVPVVIGDSCLVPPVSRYWSDRVPETLGRGGYLVHPHVEGIDEWYPDLPTFEVGDHRAAIDAIERALDDPEWRIKIRDSQRDLVLGRDTYAHRLATVLDWVGEATA